MSVAVVSRFLALLALLAAGLAVAAVSTLRSRSELGVALRTAALPLAWAVALVSTLGSLYYSEVAGFPPCRLCWYQRIAMYPLAVVLGLAALHRDVAVRRYAFPLAGIGAAIAGWHYLQQQVPSLASGACSTDTPCTAIWVQELGFVTIPFMALCGFVAVVALLAVAADPGRTP